MQALRDCKNPDCAEYAYVSSYCDAYALTFAQPKQPNLEKLRVVGERLLASYPKDRLLPKVLIGRLAYDARYEADIERIALGLKDSHPDDSYFLGCWAEAASIRFTHHRTSANLEEALRRLAILRDKLVAEGDSKGVANVDWYVKFAKSQPLKGQ